MARRDYVRDGVTVHWDSEICIHSGVCARTLPAVFRPRERPWLTPEAAEVEELVAAVLACPSGALRHTRTGSDPTTEEGAMATTDKPTTDQPTTDQPTTDQPATDQPAAVTITVSVDGPYEVSGPVRVVASDGVTIKEGERLWLCRCGQSAAKPFCDGTHRKVGFTDSGLGAKREKDAARDAAT